LSVYNGIEETKLVTFYDRYFSKVGEDSEFSSLIANAFTDKYFVDSMIDNEDYEENGFIYMQKIIIGQLKLTLKSNEEFLKGFADYIFHIQFQEIFEFLADCVLYELSISNDNMKEFMEYYFLNIIIINGARYKVPELEANNELRCNIVSMIIITKTYLQGQKPIEILEKKINDLKAVQHDMFIDGLSPIEYNHKLFEEKKEILDDITQGNADLEEIHDEYRLLKIKAESKDIKPEAIREIEKGQVDLKIELKSIKEELIYLKEKEEESISKLIENSVITQYKKLEQDMNILKKQLKSQLNVAEESRNNYESVKATLVKALISKKKKL
jgi:hypothetical protein